MAKPTTTQFSGQTEKGQGVLTQPVFADKLSSKYLMETNFKNCKWPRNVV